MKDWLAKPKTHYWLAIVGTASIILLTAYALVQQSTRQAADDLPLATSQIVKHELDSGVAPSNVVPSVKTDLAKDSTPFVIVTDNSQKILASSATLNGKTPLPPQGVFDFTKDNGTDHITWQPATNSRLATRITKYASGFIITGQSLKQFENRIGTYNLFLISAFIAIVIWTSLILFFLPTVVTINTK